MKKFLLSAIVLAGAVDVFGQGQLYVDNSFNNDPSPSATANGLFFSDIGGVIGGGLGPIPLCFSVNFYGGTDSAGLILLKSFPLSTLSDWPVYPGIFSDPTGLAITVPGATTSAFFRIEAWVGGYGSTYASAALRGSSGVFVNPVAQSPNALPTLTGMPAVVIGIPEPGGLTLVSLGAGLLLVCRRK